MPGMTSPWPDHDREGREWGTDDELAGLLGSIRRHILDAPGGVWDAEARSAAETLTAKLSARLSRR